MELKKYQYKDGNFLPESSWFPFNKKKYTPHQSTRYLNIDITQSAKELPELYEKRENCCACTACYSVCPKDAISMDEDEEGFLYPVVDASKCIRCYACLKVCAFKTDQKTTGYY